MTNSTTNPTRKPDPVSAMHRDQRAKKSNSDPNSGPINSEEKLVQVIRDPVQFTRRILGVDLWGVQADILAALNKPNARVAVKACHASGKTFTAGNGVAWFMVRYTDAIIPTTAPTWAQVRNLLWKEIDTAAKNSKIVLPPVRTTDWRFSRDHYATGISTKETERFQGFHAPHILIVVDEGPGVAEEIWLAIEGIESGGDVRILTLGNPTITSGRFYNAFNRNRGQWTTFTIDAFDTPNFSTLPGKTWEEKLEYLIWAETHDSDVFNENPNPYLTTRKWVLDRSRDWTTSSPLWTARVRGNFPSQSSTSLIALDWAEQAQYVEPINGRHVVSCDVARFGVNYTAYCELFGNEINRMWKYQHRDTVATFRELQSIYRKDPQVVIVVDDSGVGGGVVDMLRDNNIPVIAFNAGSEVTYNDDTLNRGSEAYWNLSISLRDREVCFGPELSPMMVEELIAQLVQIEYKFNNKNKIQVMKSGLKDDLPSPDLADCLNLAWVGKRLDNNNPALSSISISPGIPQSGVLQGQVDSTYSIRDKPRLFNGFGNGSGRAPAGQRQIMRSNELSSDPELLQGSVTGALIMLCPGCGKIASLSELGRSDGKRHYNLECGSCGDKRVLSVSLG